LLYYSLSHSLEFLRAENEAFEMPLPSWPNMPPLGKRMGEENRTVDDVQGKFERIASIAAATVPPHPSTPPQTPSESEEESNESSEWESDVSTEEDTARPLDLDADMGNTTFATS
jgi:hypothetical protein